eukprot:TRINITY_DN4274_c0_g1_i1.p2 TRINITY_DN4274_c0_g1~~TRINITY_DN4274_c0_g1_i1.p2  ORF type:complete len:154 (-),score=23.94 TRINITY_DN4274_c0_g1_i1:77-538(-)
MMGLCTEHTHTQNSHETNPAPPSQPPQEEQGRGAFTVQDTEEDKNLYQAAAHTQIENKRPVGSSLSLSHLSLFFSLSRSVALTLHLYPYGGGLFAYDVYELPRFAATAKGVVGVFGAAKGYALPIELDRRSWYVTGVPGWVCKGDAADDSGGV